MSESAVTFLLLGLAFGALAVIVMAVSIIGHVVKRPIRKARAGGRSSLAAMAPRW